MNAAAAALPKVELHCHLEGAAPPSLIKKLAQRNGMVPPVELMNDDDQFVWTDFDSFLRAFDLASACIRTAIDYRDVTYEYLCACAAEGTIYVEVFVSPGHAADVGLSYEALVEGVAAGIADAERDFGIVCRIIITCVRHLGGEKAVDVARTAVANPHPFVVGFGMGGDETAHAIGDFTAAFNLARDGGLQTTVHAGEVCGPESVAGALDTLPVSRIGHGVRAIEDLKLVERIAAEGIHLEVCPGSNLALGIYGSSAEHPFADLMKAGCHVSLSSDDPPYFNTTIGKEYQHAHEALGLSIAELQQVTLNAINAAFVDDATKHLLKAKL